jgi:hypothetical protein
MCQQSKIQNFTADYKNDAVERHEKRRFKAIFPEAIETEIWKLAIHFVVQKPGLVFDMGC